MIFVSAKYEAYHSHKKRHLSIDIMKVLAALKASLPPLFYAPVGRVDIHYTQQPPDVIFLRGFLQGSRHLYRVKGPFYEHLYILPFFVNLF